VKICVTSLYSALDKKNNKKYNAKLGNFVHIVDLSLFAIFAQL
jgi:hypothetical protein